MRTLAERVSIGILALLLVTFGLALASLILNVLILSKQAPPASEQQATNAAASRGDGTNGVESREDASQTTTPTTVTCPPSGWSTESPPVINSSDGFRAAAKILLKGLDITVDPCQDFYAFTCNSYIRNNPLSPDKTRIGTYDETQDIVFDRVRQVIESVSQDIADGKAVSQTEKIIANVYGLCLKNANETSVNKAEMIRERLVKQFHGFPALRPKWQAFKNMQEFWKAIGRWEAQYNIPTILNSFVTVDFEDKANSALYFNQAYLMMPRDFYVKPQFLAQSDHYLELVQDMMKTYNTAVGGGASDDTIEQAATEAVQFETQLALAIVPGDELRNYKQQYNRYTVDQLAEAYPSIDFASYISGLGIDATSDESFIVVQPAYFGVLDAILQGNQWKQSTIVNFIIIRALFAHSNFLGGKFKQLRRRLNVLTRSEEYGKFDLKKSGDYDGEALDCVSILANAIPYGVGYLYVRNISERDAMLDTLEWLTPASKQAAVKKSQNLVKNIGWPYWYNFTDTTSLDGHHTQYNVIANSTDYFDALLALAAAFQQTENFGLLGQPPDRKEFLMSAAVVNAWYQPERNSITIPYAILNPPYYRYDFPQAYNYAGQGGTAGHELSHGFDDEGVQFGPYGELSDCNWSRCGWMDKNSTLGFLDMAQCVVSYYSSQCCPVKSGSVRCASGANTQGENIADLAGQQAAYKAYRKYVANELNGVEEGRLPGMEQFTANQVFWITYGYSWCMNWSEKRLVNLLLTNPHAPGSCRVNQVVQNIPAFGQDFKCPIGSPMYPYPQNRCNVWTGY